MNDYNATAISIGVVICGAMFLLFLYLRDYTLFFDRLFGAMEPSQFFDDGEKNPELVQKALSGMRELDDEDLLMLIGIINRLHKKK